MVISKNFLFSLKIRQIYAEVSVVQLNVNDVDTLLNVSKERMKSAL